MPKSKKAKVVNLTKVTKKARASKVEAAENIRKYLKENRYCHVVNIVNGENKYLQGLRELLKPGRMFATRNRVMQRALGTTKESSAAPGLYKLSGLLTGSAALLVTNDEASQVAEKLTSVRTETWARAGDKAKGSVGLEAGMDALAPFPHSLEPIFRGLGLPTALIDGKIGLQGDVVVCREGEPLSANAARILRHLGIQMGEFRVELIGSWDSQNGSVRLHGGI